MKYAAVTLIGMYCLVGACIGYGIITSLPHIAAVAHQERCLSQPWLDTSHGC